MLKARPLDLAIGKDNEVWFIYSINSDTLFKDFSFNFQVNLRKSQVETQYDIYHDKRFLASGM